MESERIGVEREKSEEERIKQERRSMEKKGEEERGEELDNQLKAQCDFLGRNPLWHTQCRAKYTNRKTVDQKRKKVEKPEGTSFEAELNPEPDSSRPTKKNTDVNATAHQTQGGVLHLWKSTHDQGE
ncbi:unnamed protein product [Leuciscus chuanchicus]